jgi:hypothetical protein
MSILSFSKSLYSITFASMGQNNLFRTAMHYGSMSGIAVFLFYMLLYFSDFNIFGTMSVLGVWIPVLFLVLATRFHRNHNLAGTITYGQGIAIGFSTTVFSCTLFGLAFYLFGALYDPNLLESYKSQAAESLEAGKAILSDKMMDTAMESIELVTMESLAFSESFNKLILGILASLIIAAIFRRTPQPV